MKRLLFILCLTVCILGWVTAVSATQIDEGESVTWCFNTQSVTQGTTVDQIRWEVDFSGDLLNPEEYIGWNWNDELNSSPLIQAMFSPSYSPPGYDWTVLISGYYPLTNQWVVDGDLYITIKMYTGSVNVDSAPKILELYYQDTPFNIQPISGTLCSPIEHGCYTITQLADNTYVTYQMRISDSGQVVWQAQDPNGTDYEIFLYDGTEVKQLTHSTYDDNYPQINDSGQVVWSEWTGSNNDVFLYDGTEVKQLTYTYYGGLVPSISDCGQVVWQGYTNYDWEIFLYDIATEATTQLTDNAYHDVVTRISDCGQVVWEAQGPIGTDYEIFLYDVATEVTTQLTNNIYDDTFSDVDTQVNDSGQVVWKEWGPNGADFEIFLYDGTEVKQLTDNDYDDLHPQINNAGQVVWYTNIGSNQEVFFYDGTTTINLSNQEGSDINPGINDSGQVVWQGQGPDGGEFEIFLYDGTTTIQLTDNLYVDQYPQINSSGQVAWRTWVGGSDYKVFLATPTSCTPPSGDTPPGTDVVSVPEDSTTEGSTPVTVTFDNVTTGGETTLTTSNTGTGTPPPPTGLKIGNPPTYYEISTTADYDGSIEICIDYTDISYGNEKNLRLFHDNGAGGWDDVTSSLDTDNNVICGIISSFSYFVILEPTIVAPEDPVSIVNPVGFTAEIYYSGDIYNLSATCGWGDTETSADSISQSTPESVLVTCSHTYSNAGVFTVDLNVSEGVNPYWSDSYQYIVVYDPDSGFVTGGGWINSPEGAYVADPSLAGKATFGFVSKYKKGVIVPIGQTEFQFQTADLNFHSASYDWLVVTGADYAKFKGTGTINDQLDPNGNLYKFMLWAGDNEPDTFRIRIWEEDEATAVETDIYDNGFDQEIGGGSIVIHAK